MSVLARIVKDNAQPQASQPAPDVDAIVIAYNAAPIGSPERAELKAQLHKAMQS